MPKRSGMRAQALKGFRDYLPEEMLAKDRMLEVVRGVFEAFGYPPLQTPALEYSELLLGKYGQEGEMLMYRFRDHGDRDICMRYDLTVPLARVVAEHGARLTFPFRRYQIAPVWRAEKPGRGRFREFVQCDVDLVGVESAAADAEMILVDVAVLKALGVSSFTVRMNHRGALRALTRRLGLDSDAAETAFLRLLDKASKIGEERFRDALQKELNLKAHQVEELREFTRVSSDPRETLARMRQQIKGSDGDEALRRMSEVVELVEAGGELDHLLIDPSIARGLSYYTGITYETVLDDLPSFGSVMSGGRYDALVGMFSRKEYPAVGISLGVDRLFSGLQELKMVDSRRSPARVMVASFEEGGGVPEAALAARLRTAGIPTLLYPSAAKLKKQLKYCNEMQIPYVVFIGKDEESRGMVTLKNMESGEQKELRPEEVIEEVGRAEVPGDVG